jgi:UDP-N-acetylglucosamine 2-epimerase (non-hydrolysing)
VDANENLVSEGIDGARIKLVGNIMIDSLEMLRSDIEASETFKNYELKRDSYAVATFHRPSNVDSAETLQELVEQLNAVAKKCPVIFPLHPRTKARLEQFGLWENINSNGVLIEVEGGRRFTGLLIACITLLRKNQKLRFLQYRRESLLFLF